MNQITAFLNDTLGISPANQSKILYSILILLVLGVIRFGILKLVWRLTEDPKSRYSWRRSVSFTIGFLTIILVGSVWIKAIGEFGAFLGLLTAGRAIALKDPLTNIAGWIFILTRKPFSLGDRIQIGDHKGDVIDLRLFQFTLLEIGAMLARCDLEFLGLELSRPADRARFGAEHPDRDALRSLPVWHAFETRHRDTFGDTYRIWARRRPATP